MDSERRSHLLDIIQNASIAHKQWVEEGDSTIIPEDLIYQRFQEIADQAKVIYRQRAEPLELLFVDFAPQWQAFVSAQQTTMDTTMLPGEELWAAFEKLTNSGISARMPKLKRIEPIAELLEQEVGKAQICKIYGFMDESGAPDLGKLDEEIAEPGKWTGPGKGWVAPVNRHLASQITQLQIENDAVNRRRAAKVSAATTPAKESIEQLVAGGVAAVQISRLKKITVDQVFDYCQQHGLPRPPYDYSEVLQQPGAHDPTVSAERQQQMDMLGRDQSPQFRQPLHPMRDKPVTGPAGAQDDAGPVAEEDDAAEEDMTPGVDLSELPPEEANSVQEAVTYFNQGMDISAIATAMNVHGNKVRSLLNKGGINLSPARAS